MTDGIIQKAFSNTLSMPLVIENHTRLYTKKQLELLEQDLIEEIEELENHLIITPLQRHIIIGYNEK